MRFIVLAAMLALLGSAAHAQTPTAVDVATVSMTPAGVSRLVTNTICATDGRDLVCDGGAQLLPNGVISATNISATRISGDGSLLTNLPSAAASPTNVPAFLARSTSGQSIPHGTNTKINFNFEEFDTYNNFSSGRFTPTIPGKYIFTGTVGIDGNVDIFAMLYKNGSVYAWGNRTGLGGGPNQLNYSTFSIVADANGTTDYFEMYVYHTNTGNSASGLITDGTRNYFSGSLLASGNGLISGSTALGDRITSGTASGVVAMAGGTVSFTTGGTSGTAYLDTVGRFVGAGVSTTGAISATSIYAGNALQLASPTAVTTCNSTAAGTIRYNSPTTTLELCTGSGWQPMGVGIPAGTISAFASTTCPTGWSEYTAARGRFLRGIDNGAGNDPDGTRAPGGTQADALQNITGGFKLGGSFGGLDTMSGAFAVANTPTSYPNSTNPDNPGVGAASFDASRVARTSAETRPKNVAVTYCQFNGTSNGWNNPLSGGSTTAAGSTGQLQYNTGNAFDASAGLTWTNASSLLTVNGWISATNISVTALTVNGVNITSGGGASRLANLTDVTTTGVVSGSVLAFNAATSSWTALPIQQVMSTTTMVEGWPDAIKCGTSVPTILWLGNQNYSGLHYYHQTGNTTYGVTFNSSTKAYNSTLGWTQGNTGHVADCETSIGALYTAGKAFNFIGTANANGSTALGDRITSGTASGVVAMAGGTVSFTTGGTSGTAYIDTIGRFVGAGVSTTGAISATSIYAGASLQLASPTAVTTCTSTAAGTIRYNSPTTTLELCTGSGWQPMGVGIPAGTISAFASTTCPTGWSEYTAARGRFLRGIDNGAGNDPDGTRAPGSFQADMLGSHSHSASTNANQMTAAVLAAGGSSYGVYNNPGTVTVNATGGAETRAKNVAVTYCQFNGTSNGWNNPLSGGSTVAAGSTGQLQYNTGNAFDASAGLTWTNASSLLTVSGRISATNISVTALTVNGVNITSGGGASRLASLTDVTTSGAVSGSVLAFNAATSSWTALPIQQVMSTTTMVQGWPDAIRCLENSNSHAITLIISYNYFSGTTYYRFSQKADVSVEYGLAFNSSDGTYQAANTSLGTYNNDCAGKSISQLYAEGKAFNFIGSANTSASTALGDRITSGTSAVTVNSTTGIVSITQLGAGTSYVHPSLGYVGPGVSATGTVSGSKVAANELKLSGVGGNCTTADDFGRMFRNPTTGRLQLCMPRP